MLKLTILSPERKIAEAMSVQSATLPGSEGQIQILPEHAEMMGTLETGMFSYIPASGAPVIGVISSGFFQVANDVVTVLAETFEYSSEVDTARAKTAQKKAENALIDPELGSDLFRKYELKLQRAIIRQQISGKTTLDI
jgi:F-type H+-transporting ATPase subunit epsilon